MPRLIQLPLLSSPGPKTITTSGDDFIPSLYALHALKGRADIRDVTIQLTSLPSPDLLDLWDSFLVSTRQDRIHYLRGKYVPEVDGEGRATFSSGCLLYAAPGILQMRNISEWFRKLMSDVIFATTWTGKPPITIQIPRAQLRGEDLPTFSWLYSTLYEEDELHPRHLRHWREIPPLDEVVAMKRSVARRYYLRYYYAKGQLSWASYLYHRVKKWRHRASSDRAVFDPTWDTVDGWVSDPVEGPRCLARGEKNPPIPRPMERPCYSHLF